MKRNTLVEGFLKVVAKAYKINEAFLIGQWYKYADKYKKPTVVRQKKNKPDSIQEVLDYMILLKIKDAQVNSGKFYNHYEANGWVQGKGAKPIVNWKACVKTWNFEKEGPGKGVNLREYKEKSSNI